MVEHPSSLLCCVLILLGIFGRVIAQSEPTKKWGLDDPCNSALGCNVAANITCLDGFCSCLPGTHIPNAVYTGCDPISIGSPCSNDTGCSVLGVGGTCSNNICDCKTGFLFKDPKCLFIIELVGNPCKEDEDVCFLEDDGKSQHIECKGGTCACNTGYQGAPDNRQCTLVETCNVPGECSQADNRTCINGHCACFNDSHVPNSDDTKCYPVSSGFGSPCDISPQCGVLGDGFSCLNGSCGCDEGFLYMDSKCILIIDLLGSGCNDEVNVCYLEDDGTDQNVECSGDVCVCKEGYRASANQRQCKEIMGPGSACNADTICTEHSECVHDNCTCKNDYMEVGSECKRALGELCTEASNCSHTENTDCIAGVCSCLDTHTPNSDNNKCYPLSSQFGGPCELNPQCRTWGDGAICLNGSCSCQNEFLYAGGICVFIIDHVGYLCNEVEHVCFLESDGEDQHVVCKGGTCTCKTGYQETPDNRQCNLVETCTVPGECSQVDNRTCINGHCACFSGSHVPNSDDTKCYPVSAGFGGPCDISPQCSSILGDDAACLNGSCGCDEGYLYRDSKCILIIDLLGSGCNDEVNVCYLEDDGTDQNVECSGDVCVCKEGYRASENQRQCKEIKGAGSACNADTACTEHSECVHGNCTCKNDFLEVGSECKRALGELCTEASNCTHTANTDCIAGVCSCLDTHTSNSDNNKCYPLSLLYGGPCDISPQCSKWGDGAICAQGKCTCQDGFLFTGGICLFIIDEVGKNCNSRTQLCYLEDDGDYQNVYCNISTCYCKTGFEESKNHHRCLAGLGTKCVTSTICIENAECVDSKCSCKSNYVESDNICKIVLGVGSECASSDICAINSHCTNMKCTCDVGYKQDGESCVPDTGPGATCVNSDDCTDNAECVDNTCSCNSNSVPIHGTCKEAAVILGDNCTIAEECSLLLGSHTQCIDNVCSCEADSLAKNNKCLEKKDLVGTMCNASEHLCYLEADNSSENVECRENKCSCKKGYTVSEDNTKCYANIGTNCAGQISCFNQSECLESVCKCGSGTVEVDSECVKVLDVGAGCSDTTLPCTENADCVYGTCRCRNSFQAVGEVCKKGTASTLTVSLSFILAALIFTIVQQNRT